MQNNLPPSAHDALHRGNSMPENNQPAQKSFFLPPPWPRILAILLLALVSLATAYTLGGFFLAPYLVSHYAPRYAAEQLQANLRLERVRINPLLFTFESEGLSLQVEEGAPLFAVQRLFIDFELTSLFRGPWTFADLAIESPSLHLLVDNEGHLNLAKLIEKLPRSEEPPDAEKKSPPSLLLKHLILSDGTVQLSDHSRAKPLNTTVTPISLELNNISNLPGQQGTYAVSASLPDGATLGWQGEMSLQPISATGIIELKELKAATVWNLFRDGLNLAEPVGTADLKAGYNFSTRNGEPGLLVHPADLTLRGLSLSEQGASQPFLKLKRLSVSNAQIDVAARQVIFPSIRLQGGRLAARVNKAGVGNWQRLVKATPESRATKNSGKKVKSSSGKELAWRIGIEAFDSTDFGLHYSDAGRAFPISLDANLTNISLTGSSLDLGRQEALVKGLALKNGGIALTQSPAADTATQGKKSPSEDTPETPGDGDGPEAKSPWKFSLDKFSASGLELGFIDQKSKPPLAYDLTDLQAEVKDFASPGEKPLSFDLHAGIRQGGSASLSGTVSQPMGQIEAKVSIDQLNLKPLESLLAQHAALSFVSGYFSTNTLLCYSTDGSRPSLTAEGGAKIERLRLNEEDSGERLFALKELAANEFALSLNPDRLNIKEVRLQEPGAKITIFKDKSLNLAKLGKQEAGAEEKPSGKKEKSSFPVTVEKIRLNGGVVDFADYSLVLPFATRIEQCKGTASGISTKPASRASLKFEGRVGEFGQARAQGSLSPANPKQFTDISVTFRNVAMKPLSPYSATFAGRTIAAGKLNLDLGYKIKNSELLGENTVMLENFSLGERIESPGAMDLPLDLAIALLTDSKGVIDIAMPISGNIDHPEFSYGHLVRQAIFNLLTKIATAPFRALGALLGGGAEKLDTVLFEPGKAELSPPEQEKLKKMSEALEKRKQLHLAVHGGFDPALDATALKSMQVRRILAKKLDLKLDPDEEPGPVAYDQAKTQRALEKLADDSLDSFQASYEETTGRKADRVNPALALFGRASEDQEFYKALFEHLVETAPLAEEELHALAEQRSHAVIKVLTDRFGAEATRISAGDARQTEAKENRVPARLELGIP